MTNNELIAVFMGHERQRFDHNYFYDTSWDYLMPVVEKISALWDKAFHKMGGNEEFIRRVMSHELPDIDDHYMEVIALPVSSKITEVYKAVVAFIKWYNSQSEK